MKRRTATWCALAACAAAALSGCASAQTEAAADEATAPAGEWVAVVELPSGPTRIPLNLHRSSLGLAGWALGEDRVVPVRGVDPAAPGAFLVPALEVRFDLAWDPVARRWAGRAQVAAEAGSATLEPAEWDEGVAAAGFEGPAPTAVVLPDGRWMRLDCRGGGEPTVVLDAGGGNTSGVWIRVHDAIAETTRACAFDRAGLGLSDAGPLPRDAAAVAADERAMLAAAGIEGPYVLVGHSIAGLTVRTFANTHLDVAGIVLVDPTTPFQVERFLAAAPRVAGVFAVDPALDDTARKCAGDMRAGFLTVAAANVQGCSTNDPDLIEAQSSEAVSMPRASAEQGAAAAGSYGALPLIVLTAGDWTNDAPPDFTDDEKAALGDAWRELHEETAALSSIGAHRVVPETGHYIHLQQPQAVVDAVNEVVAAARARR